jgi:hypothetical protein
MKALLILFTLFCLAALSLLLFKPDLIKGRLEELLQAPGTQAVPSGDDKKKGTPPSANNLDIKREDLVGAWRATDNSELMVLRADGKCRVAYGSRFKLILDQGIFSTGQITSVVFCDWEEVRGNLRFTSLQMKEATIAKLKVDPGDQGAKVDRWKAATFTSGMYGSGPEEIKKYYHKWVKTKRIGGGIVKFTGTELTLVHEDNEKSQYVRVNPATARDPDGADAPLWEEHADFTPAPNTIPAPPSRVPPAGSGMGNY